jgi:hypothetical protein
MKKSFAIVGRGSVGKTSTLNNLIKLLDVATKGDFLVKKHIPESDDARVVFKSYKGYIIGICTPGDNSQELRENCKFFEKYDCDIIFTATRTRGKSKDVFYKYSKKYGYNIHWIGKYVVENNFEEINLHQAVDLLRLI